MVKEIPVPSAYLSSCLREEQVVVVHPCSASMVCTLKIDLNVVYVTLLMHKKSSLFGQRHSEVVVCIDPLDVVELERKEVCPIVRVYNGAAIMTRCMLGKVTLS